MFNIQKKKHIAVSRNSEVYGKKKKKQLPVRESKFEFPIRQESVGCGKKPCVRLSSAAGHALLYIHVAAARCIVTDAADSLSAASKINIRYILSRGWLR